MSTSTDLKFQHKNQREMAAHTGANGVFDSAVLAIKAGSSTDMKTTGTGVAKINNKYVALASQATIALSAVASTVIPTGYKSLLCVYQDAAGTATITLETPVLAAASYPVVPSFADTKVLIGAATIANASGANFTPGTTALDKTGITATYYNMLGGFPGLIIA